jgi:hypothetical protein
MSNETWWAHALQWGLWFLIMTLVMGWLARSHMRRHTSRESKLAR